MKALEAAERSSAPDARKWLGSLYNNIGWTHHDAGRYGLALAMFEKALKFREAMGQERESRVARWCVARCLRSLGRADEALATQKSLSAEYERVGGGDGYVQEEIGECLLALGRNAEATPYFAQAYDMLSKDPWLADNEPERLQRLKSLGNRG
jgi:tetratricopeptide (TPR) repeat protein